MKSSHVNSNVFDQEFHLNAKKFPGLIHRVDNRNHLGLKVTSMCVCITTIKNQPFLKPFNPEISL